MPRSVKTNLEQQLAELEQELIQMIYRHLKTQTG